MKKAKYSEYDTNGKLYVDCSECTRGEKGVKYATCLNRGMWNGVLFFKLGNGDFGVIMQILPEIVQLISGHSSWSSLAIYCNKKAENVKV